MLGYVVGTGKGEADVLIRDVAGRLLDAGTRLAGAVQSNTETSAGGKCQMDLHILTGTNVVRISQNLGNLSKGCRLDPGGLAQAVGLVSVALEGNTELLIVNKFGKQEAEGGGFRQVIGEAIASEIPVLTTVNSNMLEAFLGYAGELAVSLPNDADAVYRWCAAQTGAH